MAPNLIEGSFERSNSGPELYLSPLIHDNINIESDEEESLQDVSDIERDDETASYYPDPEVNYVPLEQNLKELLVRVTSTENLSTVTQVKLRVIARDVPLQHLGVYTPCLRELVLDGSVVSTLRDLGGALKNLKILKVNRCYLAHLDGMLGFEGLEELYAADNSIENSTPCAFLSNIKVIDLRRNKLKNIMHTLSFLTVCENLKHIHLEGNDELVQFSKYRHAVKSLLPGLKTLDGTAFTEEECTEEVSAENNEEISRFIKRPPSDGDNTHNKGCEFTYTENSLHRLTERLQEIESSIVLYIGVGAVLSQIQGDESRVVEYFSKVHAKPERHYCTKETNGNRQSRQPLPQIPSLFPVIGGINSPRSRPLTPEISPSAGFTIRFPPRVFLDRPLSPSFNMNNPSEPAPKRRFLGSATLIKHGD